MKTWSKYQQEIFKAIEHGTGNMVVNAVAGSGKTTTLVEAAKLVRPGQRAVFLAFNKHIATELGNRLPKGFDAMTIHSLGYKACARGYSGRMKVDGFKYNDLIDETVSAEQSVPAALHGTFAKTVLNLVNLGRLTLTDLRNQTQVDSLIAHHDLMADLAEASFEMEVSLDWLISKAVEVAARVIKSGQKAYRDNGTIDFTDMVCLPIALNLPVLRFDLVMVDEAQDLNAAQLEIVMRASAGGRVVAVGDKFQAIMGFAGADNESFQKIAARTNATEYPLSICYRCPVTHLEMAKTLVPHIEARPDAPAGVVESVEYERVSGMVHSGDLLICRTNAPLVGMALKLIAGGVQARIRGADIAAGLVKFIEQCDEVGVSGAGLTWRQLFAAKIDALVDLRTQVLSSRKHSESALQKLNDQAQCLAVYMEGNTSVSSTDELITGIRSLFADEGAAVWLSSIHRAKGLEADRVFILNSDKIELTWKGQMAWQAEQERNIHYVGLTRAKSTLYLVAQPGTPKAEATTEAQAMEAQPVLA